MTITRRPFRGVADIPRILDLVRAMPLSCRHIIDLPWRLSSPANHEERDAVYWEDPAGRVVGFAAWQYYWATLDFFILPGPKVQAAETALFAWADGRFRERDEERGYPLPYSVEYRDDDQQRLRLVESHGFTLDSDEDDYVLLEHPLAPLAPVPPLPDGFALRPLHGEREVSAYAELHRAAFASASMTPEWRARTLLTPQYQADLDLVITAPDGTLAGFCVGWFEPSRRIAQVEPIGVHPRFQRLGLAHVLLLEILHRFKEHGAEQALVETNLDRSAARHAYESAGFRQTHLIRRREKWVNPQPSTN
ncbi:MAG TPA: GNAT family N-acetyltransferase [Ktedonobacterales bacterium]